MVFQDGHTYLDPDGAFRAGVVFDNLIHRGEMPVTIGVFVDPGEPDNRNAEYDATSVASSETESTARAPETTARRSCPMRSAGSGDPHLIEPR